MKQLASPMRHPLTRAQATPLAAVLKILGDPARLQLVSLLAEYGPIRQADLISHLRHLGTPLVQSAVSKHLTALVGADLVACEPAGRETFYRLADGSIEYVASFLHPAGAR